MASSVISPNNVLCALSAAMVAAAGAGAPHPLLPTTVRLEDAAAMLAARFALNCDCQNCKSSPFGSSHHKLLSEGLRRSRSCGSGGSVHSDSESSAVTPVLSTSPFGSAQSNISAFQTGSTKSSHSSGSVLKLEPPTLEPWQQQLLSPAGVLASLADNAFASSRAAMANNSNSATRPRFFATPSLTRSTSVGSGLPKPKRKKYVDVASQHSISPRSEHSAASASGSVSSSDRSAPKREKEAVGAKRKRNSNKKYQCKFCPKRFHQNSNLVTHERTHTGDKPYKCVECKRAFSQSSNLKRHERIHVRDQNGSNSVA